MDPSSLVASLRSDVAVTAIVTLVSLVAVWLPFRRGLGLFLQARRSTRRVDREELRAKLKYRDPNALEPIAVATLRVLDDSLRESEGQPAEFVREATRQYMMAEYESHFAQPISMYSNILPPLGFIGTTVGLLVLFLSMHLADASLQLSALAFALTSSIFALAGFAVLEGLKIRLHRRLLACLDDAMAFPRTAGEGAL